MPTKLLALIVTGMPGLQKLIMFAILENLITINELANFASDYSILLILAFFSTVGISGLVLTRVSKLNDIESKMFLSTAMNYMTRNYYIYFLVILFLFYAGVFFDFLGGVLFLFSWSAYQVVRHYCISKREYFIVILFDVFSLILFVILVFKLDSVLICLSASYLFSTIGLLIQRYFFGVGHKLCDHDKKLTKNISLSNFLSSAVILSLPAVVNYNNPSLSALLGYFLSFLLLIQLLPRGFSLYYVSAFSNVVGRSAVEKILRRYNFYNSLSIVFLCFLSVLIFLICYNYNLVELLNHIDSKYYFGLLLLNIVISSITLPYSTFHLSIERTDKMLYSSIIYSFFSFFSVFLCVMDVISVDFLLISIALCGSLKLMLLYCSSKKIINGFEKDGK